MQKQTTYVGMDVRARTIRVAVLSLGGAQREEWGLANEPRAVASLARRLRGDARGAHDGWRFFHELIPPGAVLSRRRTEFPIPLSSRTQLTSSVCGHHVIRNQLGEVCDVAPAARRDQLTRLRGMPRGLVGSTARQGGHGCHAQ